MPAQWYVLHSKPNKENALAEQLSTLAVETFYPRLKANPVNPRARKFKPYFPGYLFIRVDLGQTPPSALNWLPGAIGFIAFGCGPSVVPDGLIYALQKQVSHVNAAGGETLATLKPGDIVTITSGPFAGYEAIFDARLAGDERARVLLDFLQQQVKVDVPAGALQQKQKRV